MPTHQQYAASLRTETDFFANWPPNAPREIGDFGPVNGAIFQQYGRLDSDELAALARRQSTSSANYDIMKQSSRRLVNHASIGAAASVGVGKALLSIDFTSEEGLVFVAPSNTIDEITDLAALGRILNLRRLHDKWLVQHAVVVQVVVAKTATILLSNQSEAQVGFEVAANAPVTAELVANLDAGLSMVSSSGIGIRIVGEGPLTPLFKLAILKKRIFGGDPKIAYRGALGPDRDYDLDVHDVDDEYVLVVA